MSCRIIVGHVPGYREFTKAVLFDSVTDVCFGPVMGSEEEALDFIHWLEQHPVTWRGRTESDPRVYEVGHLIDLYGTFVKETHNDQGEWVPREERGAVPACGN